MGRFLSTTSSNQVRITNTVPTTPELNGSLQSGSPKQMQHGEPRACYAMLSHNTSSVWYGAVFYDKFFQPVSRTTYDYSQTTGIAGNNFFISDSTLQYTSQVFNSVTGTQSNPTTAATSNYMNATNSAGEFGNAMIDAYSNSTLSQVRSRSGTWTTKHQNNAAAVNSDHADRSIVYVLHSGLFRAISRMDGDFAYNRRGTSHYSISGLSVNMWGSASYNNVRKELVILSYVSSSGVYKLIRFKNIDFDKFPSPHLAFTRANVVRQEVASFTLGSSWITNNNESYYNLKPVLVDNGDIYTTVMFTSSLFGLYKTVVAADGASITSSAYITGYGLTTSYGQEQSIYYGQRHVSSRDGRAVMTFCCYYYYGCGLYSFIIDRTNSTYFSPTFLNTGDTSFGHIPVPYGDDGFAVFYCGNGYAGNNGGNYITGTCNRNGSGQFEQSGTTVYMPYHTGPNTTNYPGFTQVTDYSMLTNQNVI